MRKFYLVNSNGELGLNNENGVFITDVGGLGYSVGAAYSGIPGKAFFLRSGENPPQGQLVGNLNFVGSDPYASYASFCEWLQGGELTVKYQPGSVAYSARAELASLTKTELTGGRVLSCPVAFNLLTPWTLTEQLSGTSVQITALGGYDTALKVTITGSAVTPQLTLANASGTIGSTEYSDAIAASDVFQLSTVYGDSWAKLNGEDVTGKLTLANNPFFRVPAGSSATLTCNAPMTVEAYHYWRTV